MRYLFVVACVAVLLLGIGFGALNAQPVTIDLYMHAFDVRLGVALLAAVLLGALLGGMVAAVALMLRQRRLRRRARRALTPASDVVPVEPTGTG